MRSRGLAEAATVVLAATLLTALLTYPLITGLGHLGRINTDDGRWSIWVVSWVAYALTTEPSQLYHANIFYPERNALAFSEANLGAGLIGAPVWAASGNPYLTHNVVVVVGFVVAFAGMYYLARALTGSRGAAAVAAVLFAFCPFIWARTAHIQLLLTGGMPWCLLAFHRLVDRPTLARAAALGVGLFAQAVTCAYYGIFAGLMVGIGTLVFAFSRGLWRSGRYWGAIATAAAVSVGLTLPFFLPYVSVQQDQGFSRTLEDAAMYSANAGAWLASSAWAHRWWLPALGEFSEVLFPGLLATGLGLAGVWVVFRRPDGAALMGADDPRDADPAPLRRDVGVMYGLIAVTAFWATFGPKAGLYTLLFHAVPIFSFLRAPGRMGIMVAIALAVFAAAALAQWLPGRRRPQLAAGMLALLAAAELTSAPLTALREAEPLPAAYRTLATLPYGPVAEFPYFYQRGDFPRHAYYMLNSTAHWQPLVNGYSDHIPGPWREQVVPLSSFPTRESFRILGGIGARYVVFHLELYDRRSRERLLDRLATYGQYLRPLVQQGDVWLYEIVDWPN